MDLGDDLVARQARLWCITAQITNRDLARGELVLSDELMKRGAADRAARIEHQADE